MMVVATKKLQTASTTTVEEPTDDNVVGKGSFRCIRQWRRKLQSSPLKVERVAHGSNSGGGNNARKLHLRTRLLAIEEVSVLCVDDGGSGYTRVAQGQGWVFASKVTLCS